MYKAEDVGPDVPRRGNWFTLMLGRLALRLWGWKIRGELPNVPKVVFVCAPHTSNVDGLVAAAVAMALKVRIKLMAKHTLFKPPFGGFMRWLGGLPIDRGAAGSVVDASVAKFAEYDQLWVGVAPEGTRHGTDQWKTGFYRIAEKAGIPITLAVMDYGRREVRFPLTLMPTGDLAADMAKIMACFKGVVGHRPDRMSAPLKALNAESDDKS